MRSAAARATCAMGSSTLSNFASCTFFSITRLVPFSFTTRSSLGRLKAAVCTPRLASPAVKTTLTTRMGASAPSFGLRMRGIDGQVVLQLLQLAGEARQLRRLRLVAHGDEGLEGRLVVEPLVLVDLVGADGGLDGRVELHPGHVARVVVVGEEGGGARLEVALQRGLRGEGGRLAQQRRGRAPARPGTRGCRARRRSWPSGSRRMVVKKPLAARLLRLAAAPFIQASTSSLVAPARVEVRRRRAWGPTPGRKGSLWSSRDHGPLLIRK